MRAGGSSGRRRPPQGVNQRHRCTAMARWALSRTLSVLGVVCLVHLATITSLADKRTGHEIVVVGHQLVEDHQHRVRRSYSGGGGTDVVQQQHRGRDKSSGGGHVKDPSGGQVAPGSVASTDRSSIFATENSTTVTAQVGGTATLPCVVRKFSSGVVSWIRRNDYHLLTVGLATYSSDDRFLVEHVRHLHNWGLQIKFVQPNDAGWYECQVSTHPATSIFVQLKVIEAAAEIVGAPDLHIKSGSTLRLVCTLRGATEPPMFVFWYHEERMINYDTTRGVQVRSDRASSVLTLREADKSDDGNYTCLPSNARPASIHVHVLNATAGEQPAAMQHANTSTASEGHVVSGHTATPLIVATCAVLLIAAAATTTVSTRSAPS